MPNVTFGAFVQSVLTDLADTLTQTATKAAEARLRVNDIELDIPAHMQLLEPLDAPAASEDRPFSLIVGMPSPREALPPGRIGRIRMTLEAQEIRPKDEGNP